MKDLYLFWRQCASGAKGAGRIERQRIGGVHESRAFDALDTWAGGEIGAQYERDKGTMGSNRGIIGAL